jgi:hypothetical protein
MWLEKTDIDAMLPALLKLVDGNPGAITVCMDIIKLEEKIDPGSSHLINLEIFKICGSRIWMLYKDVCNQDLIKMLATLRALQHRMLSLDKLNHAIDHRGEGIDVEKILAEVRTLYPTFIQTSQII